VKVLILKTNIMKNLKKFEGKEVKNGKAVKGGTASNFGGKVWVSKEEATLK
jgi:hypothetical protein